MEIEDEEGRKASQARTGRTRKRKGSSGANVGQENVEESSKGGTTTSKIQKVDGNKEHKVIYKYVNGQGFSSINPIRLAKTLGESLGEIKSAQILADGKLLIGCSSEAQRKKAVNLKDICGTQVECFAPGNKGGLKGVVYGVSLEMTSEDLLRGIERAKVVDAARIRVFREGVRRDTTTVVLTFQGEELPERVYVGCLVFKGQPYGRPPLLCFKCQRYGHVAAVCRGECGKCGSNHDFSKCEEVALRCGSCGGGHIAGSRECEHYKQAAKVQSFREVNKGVTYAEAFKQTQSVPAPAPTVAVDSVVMNTVNFLAFIVEVMCGLKRAKNNSDVVRAVVECAQKVLGMSHVDPEYLYKPVFGKDKAQVGGVPSSQDGDT